MSSRQGSGLVLASGGIDSSAVLALARQQGMPTQALFVDYGQRAAAAEESAVAAICAEIGVPWRVVRYRGRTFRDGEIRGRNAFLLQTALLEFQEVAGTIMIGIHAGTGYRDCRPDFVDLIQRLLDFHTDGMVSVAAPFIDRNKREVFDLALDLGVPVLQTYSCEAASVSCRRCRSCLDRWALGLEEWDDPA